MTIKEKFLQSIQNKISYNKYQILLLKEWYRSTEKMPDSFFESNGFEFSNSDGKPKDELSIASLGNHGNNRKMIVKILVANNKAMTKLEIIKELRYFDPTIKTPEGCVRNTLSALRTRKVVRLYKDSNIKMKGGYWTLSEWWDGDKLKEEFHPSLINPVLKYTG